MKKTFNNSIIIFLCFLLLFVTIGLAAPQKLMNETNAAVTVPEYGVPFDVSYRYTPEEVHVMYNELNSGWNSFTQYVLGIQPVVGLTLFLNSIGSAKTKAVITEAHFANKGMRLTYTYTLSPISPAANKMENMRLVVE